MSEETYARPGKQRRAILSATRRALLRKQRETPREAIVRKRKRRLAQEKRTASELLPDGISPKMRASIMAAHRRQQDDPDTQDKLARAKLAKRVEMAKREAGIDRGLPLPKFLGMTEDEHAQQVEDNLPKPIAVTRAEQKKRAPK